MPDPSIGATDFALARIDQVRANRRQPDAAVRVAITGRVNGEFTYDLNLVPPGERLPGDIVVEGPNGIPFHLPEVSAAYLDGITLDADETTGALTVDNPNPLWLDPVAAGVQDFLDSEINPAVASHGGHIDLLDVRDGVAYVHMGGGCQGCGMASLTLAQGVRVAVLDRFEDIVDVLDTTDHASGANPYYQASKK